MGSVPASLIVPTQNDSDNRLLWKILTALSSVIRGTTGFLIRGTVTASINDTIPVDVNLNVGDVAVSSTNPIPALTPTFAQVISANAFTRPNDTTAYAPGDLVANSTTAGSVTPIQLAGAVRAASGVSRLERVRVRKTGTSVTNAQFRVHFFSASPSVANGDNGAFTPSSISSWIGSFDVVVDRAGSDGAIGAGVPVIGSSLTFTIPSGTTVFALVEARAAYTPAAQEQFTVIAEVYRF